MNIVLESSCSPLHFYMYDLLGLSPISNLKPTHNAKHLKNGDGLAVKLQIRVPVQKTKCVSIFSLSQLTQHSS